MVNVKIFVVEMGFSYLWYRFIFYVYGIDIFGFFVNVDVVLKYFGFNKESIVEVFINIK